MRIDEVLRASDINLALRGDDKTAVVEEVLSQLRGDDRVTNWEALRDAVIERDAAAIDAAGCAICIAHGRTKAVKGLVMAVGRSEQGFLCDDAKQPARLFFVAGIPAAFDAEYLRHVGSIVRICRDADRLAELLAASTGQEFVELLMQATEAL